MNLPPISPSRSHDTRRFQLADEWGISPADVVEIRETHIGKGLFATRAYPPQSVIGEIQGELIRSSGYGSNYAFEFDEGILLEPAEPFRYVNHSCAPNCEFDLIDDPGADVQAPRRRLYLISLRVIQAGEQFTIDYNWDAKNAIRCACNSLDCRGWVVSEAELHKITDSS